MPIFEGICQCRYGAYPEVFLDKGAAEDGAECIKRQPRQHGIRVVCERLKLLAFRNLLKHAAHTDPSRPAALIVHLHRVLQPVHQVHRAVAGEYVGVQVVNGPENGLHLVRGDPVACHGRGADPLQNGPKHFFDDAELTEKRLLVRDEFFEDVLIIHGPFQTAAAAATQRVIIARGNERVMEE